MGSNSCFSEIIADVFPPCVNTHLDAAEQQTDRTSAFIELLTLTDDQLIMCIDQQLLAATYLLNSCGRSKDWLSFNTWLWHFVLISW